MKNSDISSNSMNRAIINGVFSHEELVTFLELICLEVDISTVSKMATKKGISRNGVIYSERYRKLIIGGQKMAVSGVRNTNLPI